MKLMPIIEIRGVGNLPRDLIIEILSRLTVKNLVNCKSVCKQWLHLLSNDKLLITRHSQHSQKNPLLLFRKFSSLPKEEDGEPYKVTILLTSMDMDGASINKLKASICGPVYSFISCGALVVVSCAYRVYVCNPSVQQFVPLPRSQVPRYFTIGFGYLDGVNEYKIVHLFSREPFIGEQHMGCEAFTIKDGEGISSGSWKTVGDCPCLVPNNSSPTCVNGFLYWKLSDFILSFDLEREEFDVISYQSCLSCSNQKVVVMTGFRGCLCLVVVYEETFIVDLWMLKGNENSSWIKVHSVCLSGLDDKIEIKGIVCCDEGDGELLINTGRKDLVCYNIGNKAFRIIKNSRIVEWYKMPCLYYDGFFSLESK